MKRWARRYWPNADPVGRAILVSGAPAQVWALSKTESTPVA